MHHAQDSIHDGDDAKSYTSHEFGDILFKAYQDAGKSVPVLCFPSLMMLAGGIF